jgi:hypothetical protein
MRCPRCGVTFGADWSQGYPRDSRSPGDLIVWAVMGLVICMACVVTGWWTGDPAAYALGCSGLAITYLAATSVPRAVRVCRAWKGGTCPGCGHEQPVFWYSQ